MDKPTLHEIAAMPLPASLNAMREHYNPHWGKPIPEDGEKQSYSVRVYYHVTGDEIYDVEAFTEEEAVELAAEAFDGDPVVPDGADISDFVVTKKRERNQ